MKPNQKKQVPTKFEKVDEHTLRIVLEETQEVQLNVLLTNKALLNGRKKKLEEQLTKIKEILVEINNVLDIVKIHKIESKFLMEVLKQNEQGLEPKKIQIEEELKRVDEVLDNIEQMLGEAKKLGITPIKEPKDNNKK